jgi:multidrug efflux pump subunit AcrA (membrane-fusion protein)
MLRQLATVVVKSGEDLWYQGDTTNLSPQVEKAVNAYVDESHTKRLAVLPLREADPHADDPNRPKRRENMLGAIVIEQLVDSRAPDGLMQRVDVVRRHSSTALTNAQSHEHLFLLPLWRFIGKSRVLVTARNLPKTIIAAIVLSALIAAMWLMPWDFTVTSDGKLRPDIRSYVFAASNGIIDEVLVRDGDTVAAGDVVARQTSLDVQDELLELDGEIQKTSADIGTKEVQLRNYDSRRNQEVTAAEIQDQINQLKGYRDNLLKRRELVVKKTKLLDITSPIDGKVVTWKVHDLLLNRPVSTGTRLMEIADPTGEWELQIDVPEAKMGHVQRELGLLRKSDPGAQLEVTFILATHPGDRLVGKVTRVDESAQVSGEEGNTVRMDVAFDQGELLKLIESDDEQKDNEKTVAAAPRQLTPEEQQQIAELKLNLKVGADVKAKIHCGRAPVGYVLFHDLWEFIQSRILFRF